MNDTVEAMLKRRGIEMVRVNPAEHLIFPPDWDSAFEDELYELLKKYSFRLFIRDVIKNRRSFALSDLLKYSTMEWVERYLEFLLKRGVVDGAGKGRYRLKKTAVFSFGDTLEWFVARVFEKEFSSPSLWAVRCRGLKAGGDYDVMAAVEGRLVYVEVKSSPPKNVEEAEVKAFVERVEALTPSIAVFLEDTKLRMKDKIVPLFKGALKKRGIRFKRLTGETFAAQNRLFITNGSDIVTNLGFCLGSHLRRKSFWQP